MTERVAHIIRLSRQEASNYRTARSFIRCILAAGFMQRNPGMTAEQALDAVTRAVGADT